MTTFDRLFIHTLADLGIVALVIVRTIVYPYTVVSGPSMATA